MKESNDILNSFKGMLRIIETTLSGKEVAFKVLDIISDKESGTYALVNISGEQFYITPDSTFTKVWIEDFPIENTEYTGLSSGYAGFPTEVAGIIDYYYKNKPEGPFQHLPGIGDISLNELVSEEVKKVFVDEEQTFEAEVSTALSFIQDMSSSIKNMKIQRDLSSTNSKVDNHLNISIDNAKKAINLYFKELPEEVNEEVKKRFNQINI